MRGLASHNYPFPALDAKVSRFDVKAYLRMGRYLGDLPFRNEFRGDAAGVAVKLSCFAES